MQGKVLFWCSQRYKHVANHFWMNVLITERFARRLRIEDVQGS